MNNNFWIKIIYLSIAIISNQIIATAQTSTPLPIPSVSIDVVNYVRIWEPVKPISNIADVIHPHRSTKEVRQTTKYFDAFGRLMQIVEKGASFETNTNIQKDVVNPFLYDDFGRESIKYLPYVPTSSSNGYYKNYPFLQQVSFYESELSEPLEVNINGSGRNWAYSKTNFEASPLNRITESFAPGANWVGSEGGVTPHSKKIKYWSNTLDDAVRNWKVTDVANSFGNYTTETTYGAGELYKNVTENEQGRQVIEFKNKDGKVILKKTQLTANVETTGAGSGHSGWICTYYIYDQLNNLRAVIQPEAVKLLPENNWTLTTAMLDEHTFRYEYDHRNRMNMKKVPGAGEMYMVFDGRDRLVMVQDGNLRANGKWMVTIYDIINRPVATGLVLNSWFGSNKTFYQHSADAENSTEYPFPNGNYPVNSNWEELTKKAYDTYSALPAIGLNSSYLTTWDSHFAATNNGDFPYPQMPTQSNELKGLVTWTRVKVLNSSPEKFIYTVFIYDDKERVIQTQTKNEMLESIDVTTIQYNWVGQPLVAVQNQQINTVQAHAVVTKMFYDELGRVKEITKKINADTEKIIAKNEYDKLGNLENKKLATYYNNGAIETINYDYNIRGWLLGMNRSYLNIDNSNKFGFELAYDKRKSAFDNNSSDVYSASLFNGNISGMMWRSVGSGKKRKYDFAYDAVNRLGKADFTQYNGSWSVSEGIDFSVGGSSINSDRITYDDNGNIKEMWQKGLKLGSSDWIDQMRYTYKGGSNKLKNVTDFKNETGTTLGDFRTAVTHIQNTSKSVLTVNSNQASFDAITDYDYDINGNLIYDNNKGISSITYNHLNLPQTIIVNGKGIITYTYDAEGNKLKKTIEENNVPVFYNNSTANNTVITVTNYVEGFVYESKIYSVATGFNYTGKLLFGGHEEGRIRALYDNGSSPHLLTGFAYDYMLKDHLGNVRMLLTDEVKPAAVYQATMESASRTDEVKLFSQIPETENDKTNGFDTDNNNQKVSKLFNASGADKRVGPGVVLKVMAGDKFKALTYGWYLPNSTNFDPLPGATSILSNLVAAFTGGVATGGIHSGGQLSGSGIIDVSAGSFLTHQNNQTIGARPKAFLNWMVLDEEQFKLVEGNYGVLQVPEITGSMSKQLMQANNGSEIEVKKNGYLYVYVSNESQGSVYFDDLRIEHTRGALIEETHYYPFGLTMAGISSKAFNGTPNKEHTFQDQRFDDELGLNWTQFKWRNHDPQIGRFVEIDPLSEDYVYNSTYAFAENRVIDGVELEGLEWMPINVKGEATTSDKAIDAIWKGYDSRTGIAYPGTVSNLTINWKGSSWHYSSDAKYGDGMITITHDNGWKRNILIYNNNTARDASGRHVGQRYWDHTDISDVRGMSGFEMNRNLNSLGFAAPASGAIEMVDDPITTFGPSLIRGLAVKLISSAATQSFEKQLVQRAANFADGYVPYTTNAGVTGTLKHQAANRFLHLYQLRNGSRGLNTNFYFNRGVGNRGFLDVINRTNKTIYDFKFGNATWRAGQLEKYQRNFPGFDIQMIKPN